jgi:hypothetical protein
MNIEGRIKKIEEKLDTKDRIPKYLLAFSIKDEEEKVAKFEAENPGRPYNIIRIGSVKPIPIVGIRE